jgi:hypothetical protein
MAARTISERVLLVTFSMLAVAPFLIAATKEWFWEPEHSVAPVATALYLLVVLAFVVGRFRWAWILLAVFYGLAVVPALVHPPSTGRELLFFVLGLATFAALLCAPMRQRLRRPVRLRQRSP